MKKYLLSAQLIICLGFVCCIPQMLLGQLPNYVPTNGLVGYWPFNGNANDESGNGYNGIANGAVLTANRNGVSNSAYNLPNLNDNISVSSVSTPYIGNSLTISFWMQFPQQYNHSSIYMVKNGVAWSTGFSISVDQNDGAYGSNNYQVTFIVGSTPCSFIANQSELGTWVNIVGVYNGSDMKLYLNNILKTTVTYSSNISSPNGNLIFSDWDNPTTPSVTNRNIDDIGIWNRALTQQEITNLYNSQTLPTCSVTATNNTICAGSNVSLNVVSNTQNLEDTIVKPGNNSTPIIGSAFEYSYTTPSAGWTTNYGGWSLGNLPYVGVNTGAVPNSTFWPLGTTIYLRKQIDLSFFDLSTINWKIAVDNGYSLYINGNLVGSANQGGPAIEWEYSGTFNQNLLVPGINTIALVLTDDGAGAAVFNMMVTGTPYSSNYLWSNGATTPSITVSPTQTTTYTCTVNNNGVSCSNSQTIEVIPAPTITATNTAICAGGSTTLTASGATPSACPTLNGSLTNGLVGYWPFCGNANDASGNGNNGTVNGATLTTDRFGNANSAYSFNGTSDFISVPTSYNLNLIGSFTLSSWVKLADSNISNPNYEHHFILSKNAGITGQGTWHMALESALNQPFQIHYNADPCFCLNTMGGTSSQINDINWHIIGVSYNSVNQELKYYLDGNLVFTSFQFNYSNQITAYNLLIGKENVGLQGFFNGKLDDIAIYNRALSAAEIQQLYNQGQTTYSWSNGATTPIITVSPTQTTTYTCTVTANGTSCSSDFTVTVNPLPTVNAGNDQTVCAGTAVTLSGTGATSYAWNNSVSNGVAFTPASTATYTVTGTNTATGCTNTDQVVVNVNALPTVNAGNDQTVCAGTAVTLSGTGATSYAWNNSVSNGVAFTPASTTTYTVTGTNTATGCTNTDQVVVNVNALPTVNAGNDQTVCAGTAVTLSGTGANTYAWNNSVSNGVAFTPAATVTYTVTGTNTATGCTNTDQVVVNVNALPTVNAGNDQTVCAGTAVTLSGTGATSYAWNNSVSNGVAFTPASTATYTVTGTNTATGCTNTDQVVVIVNPIPTMSQAFNQVVCCQTTTNLVVFTSSLQGVNYLWSTSGNPFLIGSILNGTGNIPSMVISNNANVTQSLNYSVAPALNGCVGPSINFTISVLPCDINVSVPANQTFCSGDTLNEILFTGSGDNFSWTNTNFGTGIPISGNALIPSVTLVNNSQTTFDSQIIVTPSFSDFGLTCTGAAQNFNISVSPAPTVYGGPDQTLCQGQSTSLFATGASTYAWSNNVSNGVGFLPTATQVYTVTGTNSSTGCTNVDTVVVTVNALPTVSAGVDQTVCKGDSIALSGSGALSYQWDNNVSDGVLFAPQTTQTYVVTGTDANGCVDTDDVTVTVNQPSFSTLTETALDSYTLNGQTYTQSGTYTQVVSNAAGCDSTITLNLTLNFTGIEELTHSVVLSPNPTFGSLTISSVDALNENFILFDAQGRKLVTGTLKGTATTIDLTSLARGNYLLMIGEKSVYKVVKE